LAGASGNIRGIYLLENPVAKNKSEYTAVLLSVLGSLEELDGDDIVVGM
jgi:2-methylaconitate cis-trans-isomerase PrpF